LRRLAARRLPEAIWNRKKQPFRAPIANAVFNREGIMQFGDVLSPEGLAAHGLCDQQTSTTLLRRATRLEGGRTLGEREEMGLIGVLTLGLLSRHFGPGYAAHARDAAATLDRMQLRVSVDQTNTPLNSGSTFPPEAQ